MKSLAMYKLRKCLIGVIEKKRSPEPYKEFNFEFLLRRTKEELMELEDAILVGNYENAKSECADVSNFIDFIFEKLSEEKPPTIPKGA